MPESAPAHPSPPSARPRPYTYPNGSAPRPPSQPAPPPPPRQPGSTRIGSIRAGLAAAAGRTRITRLREIMRRALRRP
jgi:hypothetical protein